MRLFQLFLTGLLLHLTVFASSSHAVNPDEVLTDPVLEQRARDLSKEIRCMVCQNQSIDDSDATVAKDLRILIRERLTAGDSDTQVIQFLVDRFGEFVLLKPRFSWSNALLWLAPILFLGLGVLFGFLLMRKNKQTAGEQNPSTLSKKEKAQLTKILGESD